MTLAEFKLGKMLVYRVDHDADLIQAVTDLAEEKNVSMGTFTAIGALKRAELGFYDQEEHGYKEITIDRPCEIASCVGNISRKDNEPFTHAHAVLSDENGETMAGHLSSGKVFASEVHLQVLEGPAFERKYDNVTDLSLWEKP